MTALSPFAAAKRLMPMLPDAGRVKSCRAWLRLLHEVEQGKVRAAKGHEGARFRPARHGVTYTQRRSRPCYSAARLFGW